MYHENSHKKKQYIVYRQNLKVFADKRSLNFLKNNRPLNAKMRQGKEMKRKWENVKGKWENER